MPYFCNDEINLLFVHIPKTGGSSLELYFSSKYNISLGNDSLYGFLGNDSEVKVNSSLQHITYQTIIKYNDFFKVKLDNLEIISIVRNPYERLVSDLFWYSKINIDTPKEEVCDIIKTYLTENLDNHNLPQYTYITDDNKQLLPGIKLLHTETLNQDMVNAGYTDFNIKVNHNKNSNINYYDYLDNNSIKIINEYYDLDFELFGYEKKLVE